MYRVSEVWGGRLWGREYAPPDFLASHNSADGPGQASFLTFAELRSAPASLPLGRCPDLSLTMAAVASLLRTA